MANIFRSSEQENRKRESSYGRLPYRAGVFRRLLVYFLSIGLVPILLLVTFAILYSEELSEGSIRASLVSDAELSGTLLNAELEKYINSMELLGTDDELIRFLRTKNPDNEQITHLNQKLYLIMAGRAELLRMHVANAEGEFLINIGGLPEEHLSGLHWGIFRQMREDFLDCAIQAGSYTIGNLGTSTGFTIGTQIRYHGNVLGYVLLDIPASAIESILSSSSSHVAAKYIVTDEHGFLVYNTALPDQGAFLYAPYRSILNQAQGDTQTYEVNKERIMASTFPLATGGMIAASVSVELVLRSSDRLTLFISILAIVFAVFLIGQSKRMSQNIVKPIETICEAMRIIERGNWDMQVRVDSNDEFADMASSINHMVAQLNEQFRTNLERQDRLRLAEYKNLQAQISPHFLSNTLESIKWLARLHMYDEIQIIVEKLGVLLKSGMVFKRDMITLGEELNVVESYLTIQKIRYEDKFTAEIQIPTAFEICKVPNLVIQPIVENAIVHSVERMRGHILVEIRAERMDDLLEISIRDNGPGIPPERLHAILNGKETHHADRESIGLTNVHKRLKLYFCERYGLRIESHEGKGTTVTISMPFVTDEESEEQE